MFRALSLHKKWRVFAKRHYADHGGYAALITVLLTLVVSLIIVGGFTTFSLKEVQTTRIFTKSVESQYVAEGGVEDVVWRFVSGKQVGSTETIGVGKGTTTVQVTQTGSQRVIRSEGLRENVQRNLEVRLDLNTQASSFFYGVQVGGAGLTMGQNARVNGSVYSNGSITGASGARITGDAFAAEGNAPVLDQSWEVQNADFAVGRMEGSVVTVVDPGGSVGNYNSITVGADGFARMSYYDENARDLKFIRCLDANCATRNTTIVDSLGDVGFRYTTVLMGPDDLPRISYYDATNKDLKFARCTNADCTTKVLTVVDSASDVGQFSSMILGSDGFARISYYSVSSGNLLFARCLNEDCSLRNIRVVDSAGDIGKYTSVALGSDGFARISYQDETNDDLKFARCTDADCSAANKTTVDATGDLGSLKTNVAIGSDDFARISYYDDTNQDLKFARCTNADCTTKNITIVDSTGNVGKYSGMRLGSDGFARISYYRSGDVGFARCTNHECTTKVLTTSDRGTSSGDDVGHYNSIVIAPDGFARLSHYDNTREDLRYVRCRDENCSPPEARTDVAQSFQLSGTNTLRRVSLYIKKVGNPPNVPIRVVGTSSGDPNATVMADGMLASTLVGTSYGWVNIHFITNPSLLGTASYWVLMDLAGTDDNNYYVWGLDANAGYARGVGKYSAAWSAGPWTQITGDLNFRVFVGGSDNAIRTVAVDGSAGAHVVDASTVGGNVNSFLFNNGTVGGNVVAHAISNCTIGGNASYNSKTSCTIGGNQITPVNPPADPQALPMPITDVTINQWKSDAASGGICIPPQCASNGNFAPTACAVSLGPKKISGDLILNASCPGGQVLTITGTIWVVGNIDISNNAKIQLASGYGPLSGMVISDGWLHLSNNGVMRGSGETGSYLMFLSTASGGGHHGSAMDLHNNAVGAIFYAQNGIVYVHNNVTATELVGYGIQMENNAILSYEVGLQNVRFVSGPGGGYDVKYWKEVE